MILQAIGSVLCSMAVISITWANFRDQQKLGWAMGGVFVAGTVLLLLALQT